MGQDTGIEWCDHTINLWQGCDQVSPGCAHCYAKAINQRFSGGKHWKGARKDQRTAGIALARRLNRRAAKQGVRYRIFGGSMNDWLDDKVPVEWLRDLLDLIRTTPHLDWLMLTKRPQNWTERMIQSGEGLAVNSELRMFVLAWLEGRPPVNAWIGTTVEDQIRADQRIPQLLAIPAVVRFLSCEPLLGQVDLSRYLPRVNHGQGGDYFLSRCEACGWVGTSELLDYHSYGDDGQCFCPACHKVCEDEITGIHWVICGGESGPKARPMHPEWARSLRDQCQAAGVPFLFKQWGEHYPWTPGMAERKMVKVHLAGKVHENYVPQSRYRDECAQMTRIGKGAAGRLLDGAEHNAFPRVFSAANLPTSGKTHAR